MTVLPIRSLCAAAAGVLLSSVGAAQSLPPVRPIGTVTRVSAADLLGSVSSVRPLPGGRLLVNDITRRQVLLLDSAMNRELVVADTTAATANAYGSRVAGLIPFRGDSTLLIDPASLSMLVVDPAGKVTRVMAVPRPNDAQFMVGGPFGTPAVDSKGRIVYRGFTMPVMPPRGAGGQAPTMMAMPVMPDSAPILRVDLATRALDTASFFKIPKTSASVTQNDRGQMSVRMRMNPMPVVDDWTLLPDGTLAVIRGADYHIDWLAPDGTRSASPKIPFEWQRLSDEAKITFLDSAKTAAEAQRQRAMANMGSGGSVAVTGQGGATTTVTPNGAGAQMVFRVEMGGPAGPGGAPPGAAGGPMTMSMPSIEMVAPSDLPDYRPAFGTGASRADADGNLWIRTSKVANGGPVYDVVNRSGALVDRVQLPFGRVIAGFGAGVVYMGVRDEKGARLEVAKIR